MTKIPTSFDPYLMKDDLIATLKNSPLTSQLVSLRAEEIIEIVLEKHICRGLGDTINSLKQKLDEEKVNKKTMRSESKRKQNQNERYHEELQEVVRKQNEEMEQMSLKIEELENTNSQMENQLNECERQIDEMKRENDNFSIQNSKCKDELEKNYQVIGKLSEDLKDQERKLAEKIQISNQNELKYQK